MPNILNEIILNKKLEIEKRKASLSLAKLEELITAGDGSFKQALRKPGVNIIAEIKPKSPSAGNLCPDLNVSEIISVYNKYACAISVLTDEKFFGGSFELLSQVQQLSHLPILCKDFILDVYQCFLARYYGAQAVLLIVKILEHKKLIELYKQINNLGMTAVVEVQNAGELEQALKLQPLPKVILINNRNLEDFKINLDTTKKLAQSITRSTKGQTIVISASGLQSRSAIEELMPYCSNFLIGSQFMRADNLEQEFEELVNSKTSLSSPADTSVKQEIKTVGVLGAGIGHAQERSGGGG